jgi:hypothetical protein
MAARRRTRPSPSVVRGVFRSTDGHRIRIGGGREVFFDASCWMWG